MLLILFLIHLVRFLSKNFYVFKPIYIHESRFLSKSNLLDNESNHFYSYQEILINWIIRKFVKNYHLNQLEHLINYLYKGLKAKMRQRILEKD